MLYVEFNKKKLLEADASGTDLSAVVRGQDAETSACPSLSTTFRGMVLTDRLVGFCLHLLGSNYLNQVEMRRGDVALSYLHKPANFLVSTGQFPSIAFKGL